MDIKKNLRMIIPVAAAAVAAAVSVYAWSRGAFLPEWIDWNETTESVLQEEGMLEAVLADKKLKVSLDGDEIWETPKKLRVQDVLWADIDHDGAEELLVLCWRIGRFGTSRPFWEKDERKWSQHIYIYGMRAHSMQPVWMASDIGMQVTSWFFDEELRLIITQTGGRQTRWDWVSWGLSFLAEYEPDRMKMLVTGDNLIHDSIIREGQMWHDGDYSYLYEDVREQIADADLAILNQETIFTEDPSHYAGFPVFGTPLAVGEAIVGAGFDAAACANNHSLDQGEAGIETTVSFYKSRQIPVAGIQSTSDAGYRPFILLSRNNITCAVLNYTYGTNGIAVPEDTPWILHTLPDEEQVQEDIRLAQTQADLVIVLVHWGAEYEKEPDETQLYWKDVFALAGADVIVGNHPHVVQPWGFENIAGRRVLVYYSLGNFVAAQEDPAAKTGGLAEFTVEKTEDGCAVTEALLIPVDCYMKASGR